MFGRLLGIVSPRVRDLADSRNPNADLEQHNRIVSAIARGFVDCYPQQREAFKVGDRLMTPTTVRGLKNRAFVVKINRLLRF